MYIGSGCTNETGACGGRQLNGGRWSFEGVLDLTGEAWQIITLVSERIDSSAT